MTTFIPCPVCGQTAEIQDRLRRDPRGPITHVTAACVGGHWVILPDVTEEPDRPDASKAS